MDRNLLLYDEEVVPEGFMMVRGMAVPIQQIDQVEQLYNAKLIPETTPQDRALILRLDKELIGFVKEHGEHPEFIKFIDMPGYYFKHMPITGNVATYKIAIDTKPAWFRFKRKFTVSLPN